ncbi:hypothetical protein FHR75_004065 [Kineococcus radiotolerans]|uniref:Uncharacterized protein n=1 Tax=Kineococcus radiotolerans TaxID=131568 RepID=A0A7W4TR78_KINRA|nr:hypothetical protein [Kineococcus radiotolerans]MBB2903223.1 hypothetical protein [Kineococcus radiotolerans]
MGLTSLLTLTLTPLLADAEPREQMMLLLLAVPVAGVFGILAGYTAATTTRRDVNRGPREVGVPVTSTSGSVITLTTKESGDRSLERGDSVPLVQRSASTRADAHTGRRPRRQGGEFSVLPPRTGGCAAVAIHQADDGSREAAHLTPLSTNDGTERGSR